MDTQTTAATAITVDTILERYERECLDDLAPRTSRDYRRHIGHLRRRFGRLDATLLEPRDFADFLNIRRGKIQRVRQLAVLSAAFTIAVRRWFWLKVNVLRDVERPKSKPRDRLILDEEFAACKALAPKRVQLAMQLALLTGQRQGDLIRFKWADIREMTLDGADVPRTPRLPIQDLEAPGNRGDAGTRGRSRPMLAAQGRRSRGQRVHRTDAHRKTVHERRFQGLLATCSREVGTQWRRAPALSRYSSPRGHEVSDARDGTAAPWTHLFRHDSPRLSSGNRTREAVAANPNTTRLR